MYTLSYEAVTCNLLVTESAVTEYGSPKCKCVYALFRTQTDGHHDVFFFCSEEHREKEGEKHPSE